MAIPSDVANLGLWFKADSEAYSDGDAVGTLTDRSGSARNATQGTASLKPTYRTNRVNAKPSYDFDGVDDWAQTAGAWSTYFPSAYTVFAVFKAHTADYAGEAYNAGEQFLAEETYNAAGLGVATGGFKSIVRTATGPATYISTVGHAVNQWHTALMRWSAASATAETSIDGGVEASVATAGAFYGTGLVSVGRTPVTTVEKYFDGEVAELFIFSDKKSSGDIALMRDYIQSKYFPATPSQTEQVRDVVSRKLWLRRKPSGQLIVTAPVWMLDADILDRIYLETAMGPSEAGAGWAAKKWQRRAFSVQAIDFQGEAVSLTLLDRRPVDCLLWDAAWSRKGGSGTKADGVARFGTGGARTFTRASRAWPVNSADAKQVVLSADAEPAIDYDGELFEAAASNGNTRSSFVSGTTGLTISGSGTAVVDTAELLFAADVTVNSLKMTAGAPHSTAQVVQFPVTASYALNTVIRVGVDHLDDGGAALAVRITRAIDGNYWNDATPAWQAGAVDNSMAVVSTKDPASRWLSKAINVGGSGTTITAAVVMPSGGTASRINHLYHVEIDDRGQVGSRIVTDGAAVSRVKSRLLIENNSAKRCWIAAVGTAGAEVVPLWAAADIGNTNRTIFYVGHDASNWEWLYYDGTNDRWVFSRRVAGSTYNAVKSATPTRGTAYKIVARWTGTEGELDLTAFTASIFVDGVKGTDVGTGAAPTEAATVNLEVGSKADAENFDGHIRRRFVRPYALTDAEIARFEA